MVVVATDDPDGAVAHPQPIASIAPQCGVGQPHFRSGLARHFTAEGAAAAAELLEAGASYLFQVYAGARAVRTLM